MGFEARLVLQLNPVAMFIYSRSVYIRGYTSLERKHRMPRTRNRAHKHFQLDPIKISRAQRALRAQTETEAIERALDLVIAEHRSNRLGVEANDGSVKSGIEIKDVYGTLEP
jgi:hypothetical protein